MNDNMRFWNQFSRPPKTALKPISAGRLKGKTDIKPQWRYEAMTEAFGVVGIGWKFVVDNEWTEAVENGEILVFVNVSVYIKVDDEWSEAILGNGGSKLVSKERSGMYNDDDAYKKATTDALGTAMKMLGVGASIYAGKWNGSKYSDGAVSRSERQDDSKPANQNHRPYSPEDLRSVLARKASLIGGVPEASLSGEKNGRQWSKRQILAGEYDKVLGDKTNRYEVFEYLFDKRSSKELATAQVLAALAHLNSNRRMAENEIKSVVSKLNKEEKK